MTVDEFLVIPPYPRQTRTQDHAPGLLRTIQRDGFKATGRSVAIIKIGRKVYVANGHTRQFLWIQNSIPRPPVLLVTVYEVTTVEEADDIFAKYDNSESARTIPHKIAGALVRHGIPATSPYLTRGNYGGVLKGLFEAEQGRGRVAKLYEKEIDGVVGRWKIPLLQLDPLWRMDARAIKSGVTLAALLTLMRHGAKALDFWKAYAAYNRARNKEETTTHNPVYMAHKEATKTVMKNKGSNKDAKALAGTILECVERYLAIQSGIKGQTRGVVKGLDVLEYLHLTEEEIQERLAAPTRKKKKPKLPA
jgi:hypothetical protein